MSRSDSTRLTAETGALGPICLLHPPGTFAPTPASRISLRAIADHSDLLGGLGIDWGSGAGALAIAAARIPSVEAVLGLEISQENVRIARVNAKSNGVASKVTFVHADSYAPKTAEGRRELESLAGRASFVLANPPASDGDDGFGFRREVLAGARRFLLPEGRVFLGVSSQYGAERIRGLAGLAAGFDHRGTLATTDWVPFDLSRPDLLSCLELYVQSESLGEPVYEFRRGPDDGQIVDAREALARFRSSGVSPFMKWQTHLFVKR